MIIKSLIENSIKGMGKFHKTSIFPCGIFQCKKGINRREGEPNYDLFKLALKSTSLRIYPNYANCDWSGNSGEEQVMEDKQKILDGLSSEKKEKLISAMKNNPSIAEKLGICLIEE